MLGAEDDRPTVQPVQHGQAWQDQWRRIHRWKSRVQRTKDEYRDDVWQESQRDELFALYQSLWHLKDWIKNDSAVPNAVQTSVEAWLKSDPAAANLRVVADVANGSKHMALSRTPRAGGSSHYGTDIRVLVGGGLSQTFYIEDRTDPVKPRRREALKLADACVTDWRRFLRANGLRVPNQSRAK